MMDLFHILVVVFGGVLGFWLGGLHGKRKRLKDRRTIQLPTGKDRPRCPANIQQLPTRDGEPPTPPTMK